MAPNPRVIKAFKAMKAIGINEDKVKPVLKGLLKLYDRNWELIEEENYRALADAIFEADDTQPPEHNPTDEVPERPLKRLRRGPNVHLSSSLNNSGPMSGGIPLLTPKAEQEEQQDNPGHISARDHTKNVGKQSASPAPLATQGNANPSDSALTRIHHLDKGKEPLIPEAAKRYQRQMLESASPTLRITEPVTDRGIVGLPKQKVTHAHTLIEPKPEPFTGDDMPEYGVPIAVIHPNSSGKEDSSGRRVSVEKPNGGESSAPHSVTGENGGVASKSNGRNNHELAVIPEESPTTLEIASSPLGEVKISLSCHSMLGRPNFHMPSRDEVLNTMQEKCLRSYKILDSNFSVMQMLKDICACVLELATDSSHESEESLVTLTPPVDLLKKSAASIALGFGDPGENYSIPAGTSNGASDSHSFNELATLQIPMIPPAMNGSENFSNGGIESDREKELRDAELSSLVVVPDCQLAPEEIRSLHYLNDITKGEEAVEIPWLNEVNHEYPPSFNYVPQNLVFQNAYVNISLSKIGAENCCPTCIGDCLASSAPCICASETENEFAYTSEGLVREDFLENCISMTRDPQRQCLSYCRDCPAERSKNDEMIEPCKGHLQRKYIKECWSKCGCHKQCGNRVVQRGMRYKLQVFFTPEGKGWGLRTLEQLPKGAFVCEYVGEILTNKELHERILQMEISSNEGRCTYPVLLDAYWFLKESLKNEEALCLDSTFHGNIARFINHRCLDANLIEIPVKMETPDHHYYHLAFFTTREVNAFEELTWDYGIDFDDNDHPVRVFRCHCGSKFCRNIKRPSRSKLALR